MSIFSELVSRGRTSVDELAQTREGMREWAEGPEAYLAVTVCRIVARKAERPGQG